MTAVGTICTDNTQCQTQACYPNQKAPYEKRCAVMQTTCMSAEMPVYVSDRFVKCKSTGGQYCFSLTDTTCVYGCFNKQHTPNFRCAKHYLTCNNLQQVAITSYDYTPSCVKAIYQPCSDIDQCVFDCIIETTSDIKKCTPSMIDCSAKPNTFPVLRGTQLKCVKIPGQTCLQDDECGKKCYPATASVSNNVLKCSSKQIDCSKIPGTRVAVNIANEAICALNDGQICPTKGVSLECFNERCMQVEYDRKTLKCITLASRSVCDACDAKTQVCVANAQNEGVCSLTNGQTGCDDTSCANTCLISRANIMTCTIPCEPTCDNPCLSESTGLKPICSKLPGQQCDITIEGQCEFACLEVDFYKPFSSTRIYACSHVAPTCTSPQVAIVISTSNYAISCVPNNGDICTKAADCDSTVCYPVTKTNIQRCADSVQDCTGDTTTVSALKITGNVMAKVCIMNTGNPCTTLGNDVEDCLSGVCAQIRQDPATLKCVSTASIVTCKACDSTKICVADKKDDGTCLPINGQTGCTDSSGCANFCIASKLNVKTCSLNCKITDEFCDPQLLRCRSEITGLSPTCKSETGEFCSNPNPLCEFKCIQQKDSSDFRCSKKEPDCSAQEKIVPRVDTVGEITCEPNNGELCTQNSDCHSNTCYPVAHSQVLRDSRCSATTRTCGAGTQPSLVGTTVECKKKAGYVCTAEGTDLSCLSGICAQIQGNPKIFKCITISSVQVCKACNLTTTKCAMNTNNDGVCLLVNGQTIPEGTDCKFSCANLCIVSKLNVQTCSINCDASCNQTKCRSDPSGLLPTCFAQVGEVCVPESSICVNECLETLDSNNKRTQIFACSKTNSSCSAIELPVIKTNGDLYCQPNDGFMCDNNLGCFSNICYPVVQSEVFKCSTSAIDCTTSAEPKISALDLTLAPVCIKVVGEPCQNDSDCFTDACYYTNANIGEKKCAVKQTCQASQMPIYKDVSTSECLKIGGQDCSLSDGTCAYGCFSYRPDESTKCAGSYEPACHATHAGVIKNTDNLMKCYLVPGQDCTKETEEICQFECMKDLGANSSLKCSNSMLVCTSPQTPFISQSKTVVCQLQNHLECQADSECASNTCYPVIQSVIKKCASAPIDCTSYPGFISALDLNLVPVCIKNAGEICVIEGVDATCFSGICAQIRNDPLTLKCIPEQSIATCQSCDLTRKCVNDPSEALCLQRNGQINCVSDSCANMCIISRKKKMICSLQCEATCDPLKCKSDKTGEKPSCKPLVSGGAVAGIVVGLWFLISMCIMTLCFLKRRKQKEAKDEAEITSRDNKLQAGILRIELAGIRE
ncbi:Hypothetical_protein [Hexamita inflata]|uniref:Hypothetical_protein n=1 Tax=Hexamita inflata TaxID=28002 RepID=A0AA86V3U3_9EUKA|nr:Hypothetical protein HINF_LOCUS62822 [Hexamita inflata]